MAQAEYCKECRRIKGIACTCSMSFKDKAKATKVNWATWSATRKENNG